MIVKLPHKFVHREYQLGVIDAIFDKKKRHVFYYPHRRAGKDITFFNITVALSCSRVGTHLYLLPQLSLARRVIWNGITAERMRVLDYVPKSLIAGKPNSLEMNIELKNGSIIQLAGSSNYDAHMGTNP